MRVIIGCEESQVVTKAFRERGHEAYSCDIQPCSGGRPEWHIQGTILSSDIWKQHWDLAIFHPDCTFLTSSGAKWMSIPWRQEAQLAGLHFVKALWNMPVEKIAIENPIGRLSTLWQRPAQIVEPFMFGDPFKKATCLWLKGLPKLEPTNIVEEREQECWKMPPGPERKKKRSRTYPGLAEAMAEQWG